MRLSFFGAAGEVTGSCYLLETDRARVLLDFGLHQGGGEADQRNRTMPPIGPERLDCVVLTHGHIDHCGRLPLLVKAGFRAPIHATPATVELTEIILRDAAHLQEADAERENRAPRQGSGAAGGPPTGVGPDEGSSRPLYGVQDVEGVLKQFKTLGYDQRREVAPGVSIRFVDAGHIMGSASVEVTVREAGVDRVLAFSGDVGEKGSPILRDPTPIAHADVVILESTYGDRDHKDRQGSVVELAGVIDAARGGRGKVMIPAFAVGRTQDVLYHLGELSRSGRLDGTKVFVDSPMAIDATELYRRHRECFDAPAWALIEKGIAPLNFPNLAFTRTGEESRRLNDLGGGAVVIAASGMCTGGRILHHLKHGLWQEDSHVVIVGFQARGSLGRLLVDGARSVNIMGDRIPVKAHIHTIGGFSAHAGQTGLMQWAAAVESGARRMFLTHGEPAVRDILKAKLVKDLGRSVECPWFGDHADI